jgi:hypothetical protein
MTRLCHTHALTEVLLSSCCTSEMALFKRSLMHCFEPRMFPHWNYMYNPIPNLEM